LIDLTMEVPASTKFERLKKLSIIKGVQATANWIVIHALGGMMMCERRVKMVKKVVLDMMIRSLPMRPLMTPPGEE
jgi:hypothetical protein